MAYMCLLVCAGTMCMQGQQKLKEGIKSPGTGVKDSVSHRVGAGNRTWVLWKSSKCF